MNVDNKWRPASDPVFQGKDGKWYYWDESWTQSRGPFDDEETARERLTQYCNYIGGCGYN